MTIICPLHSSPEVEPLDTVEDVTIHCERSLCFLFSFSGFAGPAVVLEEIVLPVNGIARQLHLNVCENLFPLDRTGTSLEELSSCGCLC